MKKFVFVICLLFSVFNIYAESNTSFAVVQNSANSNAKYILYPTTNMWAFLKLDTSTGIINWPQAIEWLLNKAIVFKQIAKKIDK